MQHGYAHTRWRIGTATGRATFFHAASGLRCGSWTFLNTRGDRRRIRCCHACTAPAKRLHALHWTRRGRTPAGHRHFWGSVDRTQHASGILTSPRLQTLLPLRIAAATQLPLVGTYLWRFYRRLRCSCLPKLLYSYHIRDLVLLYYLCVSVLCLALFTATIRLRTSALVSSPPRAG